MRILWDLTDGVNEPANRDDILNGKQMDLVELGFSKVFSLLQTNKVQTVAQLWNLLQQQVVINGRLNFQQLNEFASIFELNNVAPRPLEIRINGAVVNQWNTGDPPPTFFWEVPIGSPGTGETLNRFAIVMYDSNGRQIGQLAVSPADVRTTTLFASPTNAERHTITWNPTAMQWQQFVQQAQVVGPVRWAVVGTAQGFGGTYQSSARDFRLNPL